LAGGVDESATGSANFFGPASEPPSSVDSPAGMQFPPRPPAFSPGFTSFLWGLGLGAFIWIGLLGIGVGNGSAFLFGLVAGVLIFFFVRLFGEDQLRR
jgi:hypothetical protein